MEDKNQQSTELIQKNKDINSENVKNSSCLNRNKLNVALIILIISFEKIEKIYINITSNKKLIKIIKTSFFTLLLLRYFILFNTPEYIILDKITEKENYISKYKAIRKGKNYIDKCFKDELINQQKFEHSENPKISIIIPVYKTGKLIRYIISSIQNQNFKDIEIILVNDFSNDNNYTLNIIKNLKKQDKRIIIINNNKNMGILYSRSIGVLKSKGEYIMTLDHDDLIFDENVFDTAYKSAKNGNFDIISFMHVQANEYNSKLKKIYPRDILIPHNYTVIQPRLSIYTLFENDDFYFLDYTIWGKLYKNTTYKNALNLLTCERYSMFNTLNEDIITLFAICNVAEKYKYIRKLGVFHRDYKNSTSKITLNDDKVYYGIMFGEIVFDIGKNEHKKFGAIFLYKRIYLTNDKNNKYLTKVVNKIMNSEYIENIYKDRLRKKFGKLLLIKIN